MTFTATDSRNAKTDSWLTPIPLVRKLGHFDLDPCGYPGHPTAERLITLPNDGLVQPWSGRVWLNPPYGREAGKWLDKLMKHGDGIALVFNRLDTKWLAPYLRDGFFAINGRIQFIPTQGQDASQPGTGSILIPFGYRNRAAIIKSEIKGIWFNAGWAYGIDEAWK